MCARMYLDTLMYTQTYRTMPLPPDDSYIYIYMHIHLPIHRHPHENVCVCIYIHTHGRMRTSVYIFIHVYRYVELAVCSRICLNIHKLLHLQILHFVYRYVST